jgi:PPOX class probable F420-dependent enzyme
MTPTTNEESAMTDPRPGGGVHPYRATTTGLTAAAVRVLRGRGTATIGTVGPDGLPHLAPVWFVFDDDGTVGFESSSTTRKVRNVARTGSASVLAKGTADDGGTLTVLGQGSARVVVGAEARAIARRVRRKYLSDEGMGPVSSLLDRIDDVAVELRPSRWVAWNTSMVNDAIRALPDYSEDSWDRWFLHDQA